MQQPADWLSASPQQRSSNIESAAATSRSCCLMPNHSSGKTKDPTGTTSAGPQQLCLCCSMPVCTAGLQHEHLLVNIRSAITNKLQSRQDRVMQIVNRQRQAAAACPMLSLCVVDTIEVVVPLRQHNECKISCMYDYVGQIRACSCTVENAYKKITLPAPAPDTPSRMHPARNHQPSKTRCQQPQSIGCSCQQKHRCEW